MALIVPLMLVFAGQVGFAPDAAGVSLASDSVGAAAAQDGTQQDGTQEGAPGDVDLDTPGDPADGTGSGAQPGGGGGHEPGHEPGDEPADEPADEPGHEPGHEPGDDTGEPGEPGDEGEGNEPSAVLVCQATGNPDDPYSALSVAATSVINGEGTVKTEGPANTALGVFPDEPWGNIVPPVVHPSGASFPGVNWTPAGQEFWNGDCGSDVIPPPEEHADHEQVTVCLAQSTAEDPYRAELVQATAIINGKGMPRPGGPASDPVIGVYPAEPWGAIIPPFEHPSGQEYAGLNWDGGRVIWAEGCRYVPPPPPPAPPDNPGSTDSRAVDAPVVTPAAEPAEVEAPAELVTEPAVVAAAQAAQAGPVEQAAVLVSVPEQPRPPLVVDAGAGPGAVTPWWLLVLAAGTAGALAAGGRLHGSHVWQATAMTLRGGGRDGGTDSGVPG